MANRRKMDVEFDSLQSHFGAQKRKSTRYLQVLFGDPDENRQGFALTICFANILFYVPFGSAYGEPPKDGRRVRFSAITFWRTKKKKHSLFASAFW